MLIILNDTTWLIFRKPTLDIKQWTVLSRRTDKTNIKLAGLYKGISSPLGGVALVNAIIFGTHAQVTRYIGSQGLHSHFVAGATAGLFQSFICSPLELSKTILQVQKKNQYKGAIDCLAKLYQANGLKGVYKGFFLTICREVPSFGSYFMFFELLSGGWVSFSYKYYINYLNFSNLKSTKREHQIRTVGSKKKIEFFSLYL